MKILVGTHGSLSKALVETLYLIIGKEIEIDYFMMTKDKSNDLAKSEIKEYLENNQKDELFIFTDLQGGSVCNLFTEFLINGYQFHLVAGVNLPMLLTFILEGRDKHALDTSLKEGKNGIINISDLLDEELN